MLRTMSLAGMACLALLLVGVPAAAEPAAAEPRAAESRDVSDEVVVQLVRQLGDTDYAVREAATRELRTLGPRAMAALNRIRRSGSLEVRRRANRIARDIRLIPERMLTRYELEAERYDNVAQRAIDTAKRAAAESLEPVQAEAARAAQLEVALLVRTKRRMLLGASNAPAPTTSPPAALRVLETLEKDTAAARATQAMMVEASRERMIEGLEELLESATAEGRNEAAEEIRQTVQAVKDGFSKVADDPGMVARLQTKPGETHFFKVKGAVGGAVWGTDVYTTDSTIAAAAVHAGVLEAGQTAVVKITVLPGRVSYPASERHGVMSSTWGAYSSSYKIEKATGALGDGAAANDPAVAKLVSVYRGELAALEKQLAERLVGLRKQAAADLGPIQDARTRADRLDEAVAIREHRRRLTGSAIAKDVELPEAAGRLLAEVDRTSAAATKVATGRIRVIRDRLVAELDRVADQYELARQPEATDIRDMIRDLENGYTKAIADPGTVNQLKTTPGKSYYVKVTGAAAGSVWGTDQYTGDSRIAVAAVHAGVVKVGQTAVVKLRIQPGRPAFTGSTRNGVTSGSWGAYQVSYSLKKAFRTLDPVGKGP